MRVFSVMQSFSRTCRKLGLVPGCAWKRLRRTRTTTYSRPDLRRHARRRLRRMRPSQTHSTRIRLSSSTRQSVRVQPRRNGSRPGHSPHRQISHPPCLTRRLETKPTRKQARTGSCPRWRQAYGQTAAPQWPASHPCLVP